MHKSNTCRLSTGWLVALALILTVSAASAQDKGVIFQNGKVFLGTGEVLDKGSVVVSADGKVEAVGKDVKAPAGYTVIDASGKVITPGFADPNTTLGLVEISAVSTTVDHIVHTPDPVRAAFRAEDGFNPNSSVIAVQRTGGVTAAGITPHSGMISGTAAWIELGAERGSGRVAETGVALYMNYGHKSNGSRGEDLMRLRELFEDARFYLKNQGKFDENRSRHLAASRLDLKALVPVLKGEKRLVIRTARASDILAMVRFAQEEKIKIAIEHGQEAWMVADELAAAKVPVIVNSMHNLPADFDRLGARADNAALLQKAGVEVAFSVFDTHNARNLRQIAGNAVRAGMPHDAAIRAMTLAPAIIFGLDEKYGSLEKDKRAHVVVWSGDPLEFSSRVEHLYIGAKSVSLHNRQKALLKKYRTLPRREKPAEFDPVDMDRP